jgi:outer membrane protein TolC
MNKVSILFLLFLGSLNGEVLTLHNAQQLMFENNKNLKATELEITKMQYALKETRSSLFPTVDLSGGITYLSEKGEVTIENPKLGKQTIETGRNDRIETGIDCSYPLFTGFSRTNAIKGVQAAITQREAALRSARNNASFTLARLYCQMDFKVKNLETTRKHISTLEKYLQQVKELREGGLSTKTKELEVQSKLFNSQVVLAGTLQTIDSLRREIINLTGSHDSLCMPEENIIYFDKISIPTEIDTLRAELRSIDATKKQLDASQSVISSKKYPVIAANTGYRFGRPGLNGNSDDFMGYFIAGLQVKFNLFDGFKNTNQIHQIVVSKEILEKNKEESVDSWKNALSISQQQILFLDKKVEAAQQSIMAAQALVQSSKEQFDAGQLTQIEYLDAMDNDAIAQLLLEQALFERRLTILTGLFISGTDLKF